MKRLLHGNLGLKLLALIMAVLLELSFYSPNNSVTTWVAVHVELRNLPQNMMILRPLPGEQGLTVRCRLQGPGPVIRQLDLGGRKFTVDVSSEMPQTVKVALDPSQLGLPSSVEVREIAPSAIEVTTEYVSERELKVDVVHNGKIAQGYRLHTVSVSPETVRVKGPRSMLRNLKKVETEELNLVGMRASRNMRVSLVEPPQFSIYSNSSVEVFVDIQPIIEERTFKRVKVLLLAPEGGAASVEPRLVRIVLSGPQAELLKISKEALSVTADARALGPGVHELPLLGEFPEGLHLIRSEPALVRVKVTKK